MFSHFTGISLGEYIRRRKLSDAAIKLFNENISILEVVLTYGYESPDAFTYAFKKYHGILQSEVKKKNIQLTNYPKLSFQITLKGSELMKYRLVDKEAFQVMGVSIRTTHYENIDLKRIPKFWEEFHQSNQFDELLKHSIDENMLGVCYDFKPGGEFSYLIGVFGGLQETPYEKLTIPKSTWAVFESKGPMPQAIQKAWSDIYENFLPNSGYERAPLPDFELYPNEDDLCEVWIPIIKK